MPNSSYRDAGTKGSAKFPFPSLLFHNTAVLYQNVLVLLSSVIRMPSTMKAIKLTRPGEAEIQEVPIPALRDDYVLVKVKAVALNPTDW